MRSTPKLSRRPRAFKKAVSLPVPAKIFMLNNCESRGFSELSLLALRQSLLGKTEVSEGICHLWCWRLCAFSQPGSAHRCSPRLHLPPSTVDLRQTSGDSCRSALEARRVLGLVCPLFGPCRALSLAIQAFCGVILTSSIELLPAEDRDETLIWGKPTMNGYGTSLFWVYFMATISNGDLNIYCHGLVVYEFTFLHKKKSVPMLFSLVACRY